MPSCFKENEKKNAFEKNVYERCVYESLDDKSLS